MDLAAFFSLPSLTLTQLLHRLVAVAIVIGVYGWIVVVLIDHLGDPGPRHDGRRTPNPLAHLDLIGLVHALFFRVPWIPRLDVDVTKLRGGVGGALVVVVSASVALSLVSLAALGLRSLLSTVLPGDAALVASALLNATADMAIVTAVLQLLPLPPLVGALWAPWAARWPHAWNGTAMRWVGIGIIVMASLTGLLPRWAGHLSQGWRSLVGF